MDKRTVPGAPPFSPWRIAWLLLVPLAMLLFLSKTAQVMAGFTWLGNTLEPSLRGFLQWVWGFPALRLLMLVLASTAIARWFFPAVPRLLVVVPMTVALWVGLALARVLVGAGQATLFQTLTHWTTSAAEQVWMVLACIWNDAFSVAVLVLGVGVLLQFLPARLRPGFVRAVQVLVVLLCALVGLDYVYQLATGQPTNSRVLVFAATNARDMLPMVSAETTPFRAAAIGGGIVLALAWAWRTRWLSRVPMDYHWHPDAALALPSVFAAAAFFPAPAVGFLEVERHTQGTLAALVKTIKPLPSQEIRKQAMRAYEKAGHAKWHSDKMRLVPTTNAPRKNVVIVMLESVRAASTTLHSPELPTTPFLKELARRGTQVENMNAVIPRTAAAWVAVLTGQYPLTNEGTSLWSKQRGQGAPTMRGLPSALRDVGYATSYFTPTDAGIFNDTEILENLGFDAIVTEKELTEPGMKRINYFGLADEVMVRPILDWTAAQQKAGRPFMTTIMTNVGHHNYTSPDFAQKMAGFGGVTNPTLVSYYNCLRYIDGVMAKLMKGYAKLGVLHDTVFVFVGDHGQNFGEHGLKQSFNAIYDEGVHVPAIIYAPGMPTVLPPNRKIAGPRQQIDILPTVVELLGYRAEGANLPGVSLLTLPDPNRRLFFSSSVEWTFLAARQGQRKFIYSFDREPIEAYDLDKDPDELHPLKNVDARELADIRQAMLEWKVNAELAMVGPMEDTAPSARQLAPD